MIKDNNYPDSITIGKLDNGKFRYSVRYKKEKIKMQSTKSRKSPMLAWKDAMKAINCWRKGEINFIQ